MPNSSPAKVGVWVPLGVAISSSETARNSNSQRWVPCHKQQQQQHSSKSSKSPATGTACHRTRQSGDCRQKIWDIEPTHRPSTDI